MTSLIEQLRESLKEPDAGSFQLMGEDMWRVAGSALRGAAADWEAQLAATVPADLQERFVAEQEQHLAEAHQWMRRYNHSLHRRVQGYVELGRSCGFEYPWPVVATLGICQVETGIAKSYLYGLVGSFARRLGSALLDRIADDTQDVLRRTNRAIFADSVPVVLLALRCNALRSGGDLRLAQALLQGPLPLLMDAESRLLATSLYERLAIRDGASRFRALAELTLRHFQREQAIFSHHLGGRRNRSRPRSALMRRLVTLRSVPAPTIVRQFPSRKPQVVFRDYPLPPGFDIRDHTARVAEFGKAFVGSVTGGQEQYQVAVDYVVNRFGKPGERFFVRFSSAHV